MKKNSGAPKPPKGLSKEASAWWRDLRDEFEIDDAGGLAFLTQAAEAFATVRACQVARKGAVTAMDRFGQLRPHPLLAAERDARGQMMQAIRNLNLDLEPLQGRVGRPGGGD